VGIEEVQDGVSDIYFGPIRLGVVSSVGNKAILRRDAGRIRATIAL
jgi:hypothetical protein